MLEGGCAGHGLGLTCCSLSVGFFLLPEALVRLIDHVAGELLSSGGDWQLLVLS